MSKAFTKESDESAADEALEIPPLALPPGARNYMTPAGAQKLQEEHRRLTDEERPRLIADASADSKGRLRRLDARLRALQERLDLLEVVEPAPHDRVRFGTEVSVIDEDGRPARYTIVGIDEAEPARGRISWISPLAQALLNAAVGDAVEFHSPRGQVELEITAIR